MPDFSTDLLNAASPYLNAAIAAHGLDGALIYGQCNQESHFDPNAFANDRNGGSYGLMQMSLPTAQGLGYTGSAEGLFDPTTNCNLGCALMAQLLARYNGDASKALAAYNAGPGNLLGGAPYATAVLLRAAWFADLFAGQDDSGTPTTEGGAPIGAVVSVASALMTAYAIYRALR